MDETMAELRRREFGRLDAEGHAYLDHTGSALYPDSLVRAHAELLRGSTLGNPHSRSPSSRLSTEHVATARRRVLDFFRADPAEYEAIFTANATGALKLVGEAYPFGAESCFLLTADNHNSVNGIREFAAAHGAATRYIPLGPDLRVASLAAELGEPRRGAHNLLAYPAQSNFSGVKHPLEWIELAHDRGYDVLLDAAAFVPTSRLDLSRVKPDFACVSFYKMFGYPTGIGALLARREALAKLHRPWFGGGTVRFASAQNAVHIPYRDAAAFEDGTPNFLAVAAVTSGLDFLDEVGMERVSAHVAGVVAVLLRELTTLRHGSGAPLVRVYGPSSPEGRGGTVAFNLLGPDGAVVDCRLVEAAAADVGISIRTGYFCNPGAAETSFEIADEEALRCFEELAGDDFTLARFSVCLHDKPVGAVRVSLGVSSNEADVRRLVEMLVALAERVAPGGRVGV